MDMISPKNSWYKYGLRSEKDNQIYAKITNIEEVLKCFGLDILVESSSMLMAKRNIFMTVILDILFNTNFTLVHWQQIFQLWNFNQKSGTKKSIEIFWVT